MKRVSLKKETLSYGMTEELNTLRTNIQFSGVDKKVILQTSCMAGEGKSSTLLLLAKSLTEIGKKVLVVDADMRKSVLVNHVEQGAVTQGLSHYLSGQCSLADAVYGTDIRGLHILFAGPIPPNPTELLSSELFETTIASCREIYDYVLIDSAPLGLVVDAAIIAKCCDASILLIEANTVKYRFAQSVQEKLIAAGAPLLGVVLNKVDRSKSGKYYSRYYKKYYGQKYGGYYRSDEGAEHLEQK